MSATETELRRLLKLAIHLFTPLADRKCGNSYGTPCDDNNPSYMCRYHRWIKNARLISREASHAE
jgi:hypothetical protein